MPQSATIIGEAEIYAWLAEHDRALDRARGRIALLEQVTEQENRLSIVQSLAAGGLLSIPLALSLPWLHRTYGGTPSSAWSLFLTPASAPLLAGVVYLITIALLLQGFALGIKGQASAVAAAVVTGLAGIALAMVLLWVSSDGQMRVTTGPGMCLLLLLFLSTVWGAIALRRRLQPTDS